MLRCGAHTVCKPMCLYTHCTYLINSLYYCLRLHALWTGKISKRVIFCVVVRHTTKTTVCYFNFSSHCCSSSKYFTSTEHTSKRIHTLTHTHTHTHTERERERESERKPETKFSATWIMDSIWSIDLSFNKLIGFYRKTMSWVALTITDVFLCTCKCRIFFFEKKWNRLN